MKPNLALQASLAALREPVPVQNDWTGRPVSVDRLSILAQQDALLAWRVKCGQLQAQVDRLQGELAAANEQADRLRAAAEHAYESLGWGMDRQEAK